MFNFDVYNFYTKGYTAGFLPKDIVELCRQEINETTWVDDDGHIQYASWNLPPNLNYDSYYHEVVGELKGLNSATPKMKYIGESILALPYFDDLKRALVKHNTTNTWIRSFVPNGYGLWNRQEKLNWHNDISVGHSMFILVYLTKGGQDWDTNCGGQIRIGTENAQGQVEQVYEHYPLDGTFVVINNMNPFFKHSVVQSAQGVDRFTMSFGYCIK